MSIQEYIANKKKIQNAILNFIDEEEEGIETKFREMSILLTDPTLIKNKEELRQLILIISNISDNHHRTANFFDKICRIIDLIKNDIKNNFTNVEIFTFFKNNKRILLFLTKENIITMNSQLISDIKSSCSPDGNFFFDYPNMDLIKNYFSPELKCISISDVSFDSNREKGENESYICELIRQDSVEDFIQYVNKHNIDLNSRINESIFETNPFFFKKEPLLIEYCAFYGAIQIFQYIKQTKPELLKGDLWLYAIHSNNAEMIQLLEENKVLPIDRTYGECLIESIKCHHNEIANYIKNTLYNQDNTSGNYESMNYGYEDEEDEFELDASPVIYHNFEFIPDDIESIFKLIFYFFKNDYSPLMKLVNDQHQFFFDIENYDLVNVYQHSFFYGLFVAKQKDKEQSEKYLIETINDDGNYIDGLTKLMMMRGCHSILRIKGFSPVDFDHQQRATILTDYCDLSLLDYINNKKANKGGYTKMNDYIIILGITIGMNCLQKRGIVHNFLFPGSIFLDENLYPIIRNIELKKDNGAHFRDPDYLEKASLCYAPPEFASGCKFISSNVFSYSFILYHLLTKRHPFERFKNIRMFNVLKEMSRGYLPETKYIDNEFIIDFLSACWRQDPNDRLSFEEILNVITMDEFRSYFEPFDRELVKKYLDNYGSEFDEIKEKVLNY